MYDYSDYVSNKESFWDVLMSNSIYQNIFQWVMLALLIAILVFVVLIFVTIKKQIKGNTAFMAGNYASSNNVAKLVFCKNCGTQCDANVLICPKCGAKRI